MHASDGAPGRTVHGYAPLARVTKPHWPGARPPSAAFRSVDVYAVALLSHMTPRSTLEQRTDAPEEKRERKKYE